MSKLTNRSRRAQVHRLLSAAAFAAIPLWCAATSFGAATTYYWDIDGATPGAGGTAPSGTWNTGVANWTTDSTGSSSTIGWVSNSAPNINDAVFSAGSNATGSYTVNTSADLNVVVHHVTVEEGNVSFTTTGAARILFGSQDVNDFGNGFYVNTGATATIAGNVSRITGITPEGFLYKGNSGLLTVTTALSNIFQANLIVLDGAWDLGSVLGTTTLKRLGIAGAPGGSAVFQGSGNFSRALGQGVGAVDWASTVSSGGFAARGGALNVSITTAGLAWGGATNFLGNGQTLVFGSTSADNVVTWNSDINLNTVARTINVVDNPNSTADSAVFAGTLTGTGASGLTKTGNGILTLTNANSYAGTTTVSAGTLIAGTNSLASNNGAFGNSNGAVILGDTATTSNNSSASLLTGGAFTVSRAVTVANQSTSGTYTLGGNTNNSSTFSGLITVNQPLTISQVATTGTNALNITGGITAGSGSRTVTFAGPGAINVSSTGISNGAGTVSVNVSGGTTTFSATNSYTGATNVTGGKLRVDGSLNAGSAITVSNSGTILDGGGVIGGSVTLNTGTTFAPGDSPGSMEIGGALNLQSGSTLAIELGGTTFTLNGTEQYDRVKVGGLTTLAGVLSVTQVNLFSFADGQLFGIVDATGGRSGIFSNYIEGATVLSNGFLALKITYLGDVTDSTVSQTGGNDIVLYALYIPEPASACGLMLLTAPIVFRRRR